MTAYKAFLNRFSSSRTYRNEYILFVGLSETCRDIAGQCVLWGPVILHTADSHIAWKQTFTWAMRSSENQDLSGYVIRAQLTSGILLHCRRYQGLVWCLILDNLYLASPNKGWEQFLLEAAGPLGWAGSSAGHWRTGSITNLQKREKWGCQNFLFNYRVSSNGQWED